ncbi:MAG: 50S ribosomal protein L28 [Endomicrobium sp.]|jgi:ribosomal protein L28|nr:50S ribosomal protein L28 [Endomicrobium sp.]
MSYKCAVCGKGASSGNTVSHSNKASKRLFRPNLQSLNFCPFEIKRILTDNGSEFAGHAHDYFESK